MPDLFAPGFAQATVLLALRVGGLVLVAPMFSARNVPPKVKAGLIVLLTAVMAPAAYAAAGAGTQVTPATFLGETLVGFAIGLGGALFVGAAETAGDLMATTMGLSGATILDPLNGASSSVLSQLAQLFAVTLLLAVDGHLVMLDALAASALEVPVGATLSLRDGAAAMVDSGAMLFALGVQFAAPVIAASLIGNVALAVLTRAAPQINVFSLAFPIQIGLGLLATVAALAFLATAAGRWPLLLESTVSRIFAAFAR